MKFLTVYQVAGLLEDNVRFCPTHGLVERTDYQRVGYHLELFRCMRCSEYAVSLNEAQDAGLIRVSQLWSMSGSREEHLSRSSALRKNGWDWFPKRGGWCRTEVSEAKSQEPVRQGAKGLHPAPLTTEIAVTRRSGHDSLNPEK